jgi:hypothetical protein
MLQKENNMNKSIENWWERGVSYRANDAREANGGIIHIKRNKWIRRSIREGQQYDTVSNKKGGSQWHWKRIGGQIELKVIMAGGGGKGHTMVAESTKRERRKRDGGRTALFLACSLTRRYPA